MSESLETINESFIELIKIIPTVGGMTEEAARDLRTQLEDIFDRYENFEEPS